MVLVKRKVQKNFQGIKHTMDHSEDRHHQVEKIWLNSDITKNLTSLQNCKLKYQSVLAQNLQDFAKKLKMQRN